MDQAQISDIFHYPTALNREQLSFSDATPDAITRWSSKLSISQLGDTTEVIFKALYEIAELKCTETLRFDLIQALHPLIENILNNLEKKFLNQGLFHSDRNRDIIELTTRLRTFFADIYIDIAQRSEQQLKQQKFSLFKFKQNKNLKTARILSTYYALEQLGLLLVQQQMLYSSAFSNQWLMTHFLYDLSLKNQEHLISINQLQGTHHVIKNIQQSYAQVLLLEIFNTHQIRPSEIYALYQCTLDWAQKVNILTRENTLSRYIIDTTKDHPPVYNRKQHESFKPNIYIATQNLLEHINLTIQKENEYLSKNEKAYLSAPLKFHAQNVLGSNSERRHERYEYSAQLQIGFGLLTAHFYLSKAQNFQETLKLPPVQLTNSMLASDSYFIDSENQYKQNKQVNPLDQQSNKIYQSQVLDMSINGFRVRWIDQEAPNHLRTGEFILMNESINYKWKGGVIRWIKQSINSSFELGLEIIGQDVYPCAVKVFTDRKNFTYQPCLLIQNQNIEQKQSSLILPNSPLFKEQLSAHLRLNEHDIKIHLLKNLLITQSFIQMDFELLDDEQYLLIEQFIAQYSVESNSHQDVWEALK